MVLYLVARYAGATDAQALARMFALQWHQEGLASYISFEGKTDHHDAEIRHAQEWLSTQFSVDRTVDEIISSSRLAERTFKITEERRVGTERRSRMGSGWAADSEK